MDLDFDCKNGRAGIALQLSSRAPHAIATALTSAFRQARAFDTPSLKQARRNMLAKVLFQNDPRLHLFLRSGIAPE
jgi:hypothetical protein